MLSVESVCSTVRHKQLLIFFISGTRTSKIIYFCGFLALPPLFSWKLMETSLLGAPSQDLLSPMAFFDVFFFTTFWMRSWRNAWRYLFGSRMWTDDCRPAWKFFIKVIVTELCVIKSWWKIKFNKQKKFINLFFLL